MLVQSQPAPLFRRDNAMSYRLQRPDDLKSRNMIAATKSQQKARIQPPYDPIPAQKALKRAQTKKDTSKYGNFDADTLCQLLEVYIAQEKMAQAKRDHIRRERESLQTKQNPSTGTAEAEKPSSSKRTEALTTSKLQVHVRAPSDVVQKPRDDKVKVKSSKTTASSKPREGRTASTRQPARKNSTKLPDSEASKRPQSKTMHEGSLLTVESAEQTSSRPGSGHSNRDKSSMHTNKSGASTPAPYIPQSAALAFASTATANGSDRQKLIKRLSIMVPSNGNIEDDRVSQASPKAKISSDRYGPRRVDGDVLPIRSRAVFKKDLDRKTRRSIDGDKMVHDFGRRSLDSIMASELASELEFGAIEPDPTQRKKILRGQIYAERRGARWSECDDEKLPKSRDEKTGLREKLAHLRLLSPKLRGAEGGDSLDTMKVSKRKSAIFTMFR